MEALREAGAEVWVLGAGFVKPASAASPAGPLAGFTNPAPTGRVDLTALMRRLGEQQIQSVLIEGGGTLASAALAAGLVDRVYFIVAPLIIGGAEAPTAVSGEGVARLADAWRIRDMKVRRIGEDVLITGEIVRG
jgi:diaminohydroxyphosphoribosylaminopyrimidine deaminase/5-amino-6-(5-phosphoribosylamino)uracil reductase